MGEHANQLADMALCDFINDLSDSAAQRRRDDRFHFKPIGPQSFSGGVQLGAGGILLNQSPICENHAALPGSSSNFVNTHVNRGESHGDDVVLPLRLFYSSSKSAMSAVRTHIERGPGRPPACWPVVYRGLRFAGTMTILDVVLRPVQTAPRSILGHGIVHASTFGAKTRVMAVTQRPIALQAVMEPSKAASWTP
jgi:hypothetical protein